MQPGRAKRVPFAKCFREAELHSSNCGEDAASACSAKNATILGMACNTENTLTGGNSLKPPCLSLRRNPPLLSWPPSEGRHPGQQTPSFLDFKAGWPGQAWSGHDFGSNSSQHALTKPGLQAYSAARFCKSVAATSRRYAALKGFLANTPWLNAAGSRSRS